MLNVTRLLCGARSPGDSLRYGETVPGPDALPPQPSVHFRPIVVWNVTRRCNLHCIHCYSESQDREYPGELSHAQALAALEDLAAFHVPVLLLSGGEPLLRFDILELIGHARGLGLRTGLSTNGTLITPDLARDLKRAGLGYVGISIDGLQAVNDRFRGQKGAFAQALAGIRNSLKAGFRVSLRFTLTRHNKDDLGAIFDLVRQEGVPRLCIYHLAYAGRGRKLLPFDLDPQERRQALDLIFQRTMDLHQQGMPVEVLTVDNHADAGYLLLAVEKAQPERAAEVSTLLRRNGGNSAGVGIGCIDNLGFVHPDQFWRTHPLGNLRERPFSQVWTDQGNPFLAALRSRRPLLPQRCRGCRFLSICNGNLRARAETASGDPWGEDPACYLTDEETFLPATKPEPVG